jgi:hypothetical protein
MRSCRPHPNPSPKERELEEQNEDCVIDEGINKNNVEDAMFGYV